MTVLSGMRRFFSSSAGALNGSSIDYRSGVNNRTRPRELTHRDLCEVLSAFYKVNGLYETLRALGFRVDADTANLKPIRNVVPAAIDFFSAKTFPEPLELKSPNGETDEGATTTDPVLAAIEQVWDWSNWGQRRPTAAHQHALYGECYIKVVADAARGRVYFELIEASYVCDIETDERDYLTWIRLDVPKCETNHEDGSVRLYTRTEVWSKGDGTYRVWETDGDQYGKPLNTMGEPKESGTLAELGIDFVPIVRVPFHDIGEKRAIGAVLISLEVMTEADLMATNLHGVLFNDLEATTVITRDGVDANNRPLPAVRVAAAEPTFDALGRETNGTGRHADGSVTLGKRTLVSLPGGAHLEHTVPPIDYTAALAIQQDHDAHLERLVPSLAYTRISELSGADLSGRAIRFKLTPAIDQVTKARARMLAGLKAADMMALTLGKVAGIFTSLPGSFEDGSWDHSFVEQDVIVVSDFEDAQTEQLEAQAFGAWNTAGLPMAEALKRVGYSEAEATDIVNMAADDAEKAMEQQQQLMEAQTSQQDQQQPPNGPGGQPNAGR